MLFTIQRLTEENHDLSSVPSSFSALLCALPNALSSLYRMITSIPLQDKVSRKDMDAKAILHFNFV